MFTNCILKLLDACVGQEQAEGQTGCTVENLSASVKNACVTDKKNTQNDSVGQKLYPKLLLLLAILATLWFVNPAQNLWCMSWWKDLITIPTRSMWMKT